MVHVGDQIGKIIFVRLIPCDWSSSVGVRGFDWNGILPPYVEPVIGAAGHGNKPEGGKQQAGQGLAGDTIGVQAKDPLAYAKG